MEQTFLLLFCSKYFYTVGVLEFLQTEPDPYVALVFHPLEAGSEGHHYKLMVTSNIGSRCLCDATPAWLPLKTDIDQQN